MAVRALRSVHCISLTWFYLTAETHKQLLDQKRLHPSWYLPPKCFSLHLFIIKFVQLINPEEKMQNAFLVAFAADLAS